MDGLAGGGGGNHGMQWSDRKGYQPLMILQKMQAAEDDISLYVFGIGYLLNEVKESYML
jgi:hypothetical protein